MNNPSFPQSLQASTNFNFHSRSNSQIDGLNTYSNFPVVNENRSPNNRNFRFNSKPKYVINPPERFMADYVADSGINKKKIFNKFIDHDLIKPYTRPTQTIYAPIKYDTEARKEKYSLNVCFSCPKQCLLPKYQQYTEYTFPARDKAKADLYAKTYLGTDNIAIKFPNEEDLKKKANLKDSFLEKKKKYCVSTESESSFVPKIHQKSVSNKSSVNYNIISVKGKDGTSDNTASVLEVKLNNRKKGVGEYADLTKTFAINPERKFGKAFNEDSKIFRRYTGIFTHLYDSSIRNGKLIMPFTNDKLMYKKPGK